MGGHETYCLFFISPQRAEDYGPVEVISHWHPNITINIVDDHTPWVKGSVPPPLDQCKPRQKLKA